MDKDTITKAIKKIDKQMQETEDSMLRMQGYMAGLNKAREELTAMLNQMQQ